MLSRARTFVMAASLSSALATIPAIPALAEVPPPPAESTAAVPAELPRTSLALDDAGAMFVPRGRQIGIVSLKGTDLTDFGWGRESIWAIAEASLTDLVPAPTNAQRQRQAFWPNSLRLALMNEDVPLWALEAIDGGVRRRHWGNSRSNYWNWRSRYNLNEWHRNAASEFFSLGYFPPPK